eukprot:jgi/Botrbrau1/13861/Bobra.0056s0094.1
MGLKVGIVGALASFLLVSTEGTALRKPLAAQLVGIETVPCYPSGAVCFLSSACCSKNCRALPLEASYIPLNICGLSGNPADNDGYDYEYGMPGSKRSCNGAYQLCTGPSDCCSGICQPDIPHECS